MNVDYRHDSKCVLSIIISISDHTSWFASAFSFALSQSNFLLVYQLLCGMHTLPMQSTDNFFRRKKRKEKKRKLHWNNFNILYFDNSAHNIDCGYTLEPPRRGGSIEYPQSMFWMKNKISDLRHFFSVCNTLRKLVQSNITRFVLLFQL